ncbi:MAG: adenosine kinase [Hyphomicrobiaceae bacterium]
MNGTHIDVVGLGHAIVDVIGRCEEEVLARLGSTKGHMRLVDAETAAHIYRAMGPAVEISGGSAANTMVGVASLGGRAAFIGKVAGDEFGRIFAHDIRAAGVIYDTPAVGGAAATGRSLILVTPDGERTMNTWLGVGPEITAADIDPALIQSAGIVYLEGYLFDRPQAKAAFHRAAEVATAAGRRVALTLSDSFCVERHRTEFLALIRTHVDVLFANEREITALYETDSFDAAAERARQDAEIAVLTRSAEGSVILTGNTTIPVAADPVAEVVDVTGAGDLYAAGVLYALARGHDLEFAGRLGSFAAAEVIGHLGARPASSLAVLAHRHGLLK